MNTVRWGILAPGRIAHKFATGLAGLPDAKLVAVGSRSLDRAQEFATQYGAERAHGSYEDLARDPDVDAIYVATPHNYHRDAVILCAENGKAVLCEKPFAVNAGETQLMIDAARTNDVFLMEAMWTRFLPAWQQIKRWIDAGEIGEVRLINSTFAFRSEWNPEGRLLNPALAGGGLLDVGVYVTSAAYWVTGAEPVDVVSQAHIGETGVDEQAAFVFRYGNGALAMLGCGVRTNARHVFTIYGTEGWIEVPHMFWNTERAILHRGDEEIEFAEPHIANGYEYQAREVGECLRSGRRESSILPLDETLRVMRTLDTIRSQWGLVYPFERKQS
ncbi:MAG: Gfo/Idh/MocA family protein [Spirochaetota bacterium]